MTSELFKKINIGAHIISLPIIIYLGYIITEYILSLFNYQKYALYVTIFIVILSLYTTYKLYNVKNLEKKIIKFIYPTSGVLLMIFFILLIITLI